MKWFLLKFTTREHFMHCVATGILLVAAYEEIHDGKVSETWMVLASMTIGYYFRGVSSRK